MRPERRTPAGQGERSTERQAAATVDREPVADKGARPDLVAAVGARRDEMTARGESERDALALRAAELLLALLDGDDVLAHAVIDVAAERRACVVAR